VLLVDRTCLWIVACSIDASNAGSQPPTCLPNITGDAFWLLLVLREHSPKKK
jgi:hypothetical protein